MTTDTDSEDYESPQLKQNTPSPYVSERNGTGLPGKHLRVPFAQNREDKAN